MCELEKIKRNLNEINNLDAWNILEDFKLVISIIRVCKAFIKCSTKTSLIKVGAGRTKERVNDGIYTYVE